jgi:hypothetical protein
MDEASPPKRWQKPRIYLTIVALYFIASSVGYISLFLFSAAHYNPDPDHALGAAFFAADLLLTFSYLILASLAAFSLLKKKPGFILACIVTLASIAFYSFFMLLATASQLTICFFEPNEYNNCISSLNTFWIWAVLFALPCIMLALLIKGWRGYKKVIMSSKPSS